MLLTALGQVGIVGQAAEEGRHHGAGVHFLLRRHKEESRYQTARYSNHPRIPPVKDMKRVCERPYLKQGHVLLVVLLALLGGGIAAVDEGAALLRVTVTCEKQTPSVRSRLVLHLHTMPGVGRVEQRKRS